MPHATDEATAAADRTAKRDSLLLLTEIFDESGRRLASARVRNLSATGLMAECDRMLEVGDRVRLTLRGAGEIGAAISWARDGRIGLLFDAEIDPMAARRPIAKGGNGAAPDVTTTLLSRPLG